ncbi:MAG TPA: transcription termination/antitermination NusG family protein [Lacipirellulaceae bacterium]|nr:transcription termination/antitermination NusG family protein [Lacipirellulaceae bacterium]
MLRLQDNPSMVGPTSAAMEDAQLLWNVAYCKPRQEKALAGDLREREIPYFLPMFLKETSSGGRRRRNLYPLFPSYVFVGGGERERLAALKTDRIVRFVPVAVGEQARLGQELRFLHVALEHCPDSLELYSRLVPGARARITSGPMKNIEGVIVQADNKRKLCLSVSVLGVGATIEIHADFLQAE